MSTKIACDRCEKLGSIEDFQHSTHFGWSNEKYRYDFCHKCLKDLQQIVKKWLKNASED